MMATIEELRAEHAERGIGPQLLDLLRRVVVAVSVEFPSTHYSPSGEWGSSELDDLLQSWVEDRLVGRRTLGVLLAGAATVQDLRRALMESCRWHIRNRRARGEQRNLERRSRRLLNDDPEVRGTGGTRTADTVWRLDGDDRPPIDRLDVLVRAAHELSDEELAASRWDNASYRASPILGNARLHQLLVHILRSAGPARHGDLVETLRRRFALPLSGPPEAIDALLDEPAAEATAEEEAIMAMDNDSAAELARAVVARITPDEAAAAYALYAWESFAAASRALDCSENTVRNRVRRVVRHIQDDTASHEHASTVYDHVVLILRTDTP